MKLVQSVKALPQAVKKKGRALLVTYYDRQLQRGQLKVLLLLGHMRSGSSLLVHILNSNPEVIGYGETHLAYQHEGDFAARAYHIYRSFKRLKVAETYVMDKVLGPWYLPVPELLTEDPVRGVFLVREPQASLPSILKLKMDNFNTEASVLAYYVERLQALERYARLIDDPSRAFFLTHEQLIHDTDATLDALRHFLELRAPLSEQYETTWATGKYRIGDPSETIKTGRIVRKEKKPAVEISADVLEEAQAAYARCLAVMPTLCSHAALPT